MRTVGGKIVKISKIRTPCTIEKLINRLIGAAKPAPFFNIGVHNKICKQFLGRLGSRNSAYKHITEAVICKPRSISLGFAAATGINISVNKLFVTLPQSFIPVKPNPLYIESAVLLYPFAVKQLYLLSRSAVYKKAANTRAVFPEIIQKTVPGWGDGQRLYLTGDSNRLSLAKSCLSSGGGRRNRVFPARVVKARKCPAICFKAGVIMLSEAVIVKGDGRRRGAEGIIRLNADGTAVGVLPSQ